MEIVLIAPNGEERIIFRKAGDTIKSIEGYYTVKVAAIRKCPVKVLDVSWTSWLMLRSGYEVA